MGLTPLRRAGSLFDANGLHKPEHGLSVAINDQQIGAHTAQGARAPLLPIPDLVTVKPKRAAKPPCEGDCALP